MHTFEAYVLYKSVSGPGSVIALLQRVREAHVDVKGERLGEIGKGLLVFVGIERGDHAVQADRLLERILGYRVFPDAEDRMNLSLQDVQGGLLLVSQFTLAADTRKGLRPGFSQAANPVDGEHWFNYLVQQAKCRYSSVETGLFAANMQVGLVNDGPVTFLLQVSSNEAE